MTGLFSNLRRRALLTATTAILATGTIAGPAFAANKFAAVAPTTATVANSASSSSS